MKLFRDIDSGIVLAQIRVLKSLSPLEEICHHTGRLGIVRRVLFSWEKVRSTGGWQGVLPRMVVARSKGTPGYSEEY